MSKKKFKKRTTKINIFKNYMSLGFEPNALCVLHKKFTNQQLVKFESQSPICKFTNLSPTKKSPNRHKTFQIITT